MGDHTAIKVLVGSRNPVKINAVREAFGSYFGPVLVEGVAVDSGVPSQPVNGETFAGAENRARALQVRNQEEGLGAQYSVGIEGGMIQLHDRWFGLGCMCVVDHRGRAGFGTSGLFELPTGMAAEMLGGAELGTLVDRLTGEENTKQHGGAVAYFTRGEVDRQALYVHGLKLALIPFLNEAHFT